MQLLCPLLVQLFPNCTRIHVITYTNLTEYSYIIILAGDISRDLILWGIMEKSLVLGEI